MTVDRPANPTSDRPLILGRLERPPSRPGLVLRAALLDRAARSGASVAVMSAGAGYGKTSFLKQLADRDERPTAWLSLDGMDNDPLVFMSYLAEAIGRVAPIDPRIYDSLASVRAAAPSRALLMIRSAVSTPTRPFLLVLDDVHNLTSLEALDVLTAVAEEVCAGSCVVLAGRSVPSDLVARLRVRGDLFEIGGDDLAMSTDETATLLQNEGAALTPDEIDELQRHTEGWAAGIYLAALSLAAGADRSQVVGLSGRERSVGDYLRAEILTTLDADDVALLRRTSILEHLTPSLCDAMLGRDDSALRLAALSRTNRFVDPLDPAGRWYRCHPLFRDLLQADLEADDPASIAELHRRAAAWFAEAADPDSAIEHAISAGDEGAAAALVGMFAQPTVARGLRDTALRWLDRFDDDAMVRFPTLAIVAAWIHAIVGDTGKAERYAALAESGDAEAPSLDGSTSLVSAKAMLRAAMCPDGAKRMRLDASVAYESEPTSSPWRPLSITLLGMATALDGDHEPAEVLFAEATEFTDHSQAYPAIVLAWSERAAHALVRRDLGFAAEAARVAKEIARDRHIDLYGPTALSYAVAARCSLAAGDPSKAREDLVAAQLIRPNLTQALPHVAVQARLEIADVLIGLADPPGARTQLIEIDAILAHRPDLGTLNARAEALRHRLEGRTSPRGSGMTLTAAELRILPFLPTHLSFQAIGERLFVSRSTVKTQTTSIYRKLGATSRAEAVDRAREIGLLLPPVTP